MDMQNRQMLGTDKSSMDNYIYIMSNHTSNHIKFSMSPHPGENRALVQLLHNDDMHSLF